MVKLFCYVLVYHNITVVFIATFEVNRLHKITVVSDRQLKIVTFLAKVSDTKRKHMFDF
jgi:hypothetical protein